MTTETSETGAGSRRHGVVWSVLAALAILVGGFFWLDNWVRGQVAELAVSKVEEALSLDSDQAVEVEIAGVSVLAQVLTGKLDGVSAGVDNVRLGDLSGDVQVDVVGIPVDLNDPFDVTDPIDHVEIAFVVHEDSVRQVASLLSLSAVSSVELEDGLIQLGTGIDLLGIEFSLGVGIEPFARDGRVGFAPTTVDVNGSRTSAADLSARFGPLVDSLLQPQELCIARWLPAALTVESVSVVEEELVIVIGADRRIFSEAALRELGTCDS